ncbi:MAG: hypothetical protein ACLP6G_14135 [Terriglobales bacterium]
MALEARGLGQVSINVRITAVRKLAREAASLQLRLEFKELHRPLPSDAPLQENYVQLANSMQ